MIKLYTTAFLILCCAFTVSVHAQSVTKDLTETGGEYPLQINDAANPCISDAQYEYIDRQCAANIVRLGLQTSARSQATTPSLGWPLRMANGLNDCSYYMISAYVDEDSTSGIKDWNCGSNTYNAHRGTDIASFPYPFYKMDHDYVEVIAAAPGTILFKSDTTVYDRNCSSSTNQANFIVIQHADGTYAYYFHMKHNSVTTKSVGQTVALGEHIGIVGSSGNASGPHLHFEVRTSTANTDFKDPWSGTCNHLNSSSWWAAQKPYTEPAIIKAQVGLLDPLMPACPATESPYEDSCFASGAAAKFTIFLRNETTGMTANMRIIKPDGSNLSAWIHSSTATYKSAYYSYTRTLPSVAGTYIFETVYNGDTCRKSFRVDCSAAPTAVVGIADLHAIQVSPNPANDKITISGEGLDNGDHNIMVRNMLGQAVLSDVARIDNNSIQKTLSISALPDGLYFLSLESKGSAIVRKIQKGN